MKSEKETIERLKELESIRYNIHVELTDEQKQILGEQLSILNWILEKK